MFVDESGNPVALSPEEQTEYFQKSPQPGALVDDQGKSVDPFRDLSSNDLADLVKQSPDKFDLVSQFAARPDLQKDPAVVQKVADAFHQVRQQPTDWADLIKRAPANITNIFAGLGRFGAKAVSGTAKELTSGLVGAVGAPEDVIATGQEESRQELGEVAASAEQGMTGLVTGAAKAAQALGRGLGISKQLKNYDDADKRNALFDALARTTQAQATASGQGPLAQAVTGGAVPVRPEEVAKLASPFDWEALGGATRLAGAALPSAAPLLAKAGEAATNIGGKVITGTAKAGEKTTGLVKSVTPLVSGAGGAVVGGHLAGGIPLIGNIFGAVEGIERGAKFAKHLTPVTEAFQNAADFGKQISGEAPLTSAYAQAARDALQVAPTAAAELGKGVAFDAAQVAGADTPQEKESAVGLGTAFGLLGAANAAGRHVISGQLIAPRDYAINTPIKSSGAFPDLDALHNSAFSNLTDGQKARLNATRLFLSKAAPGTDIFVTGDNPEATSNALQASGMAKSQADFYAEQRGFATRLNGRKIIGVQEPGSAPHEAFHGIEDVLGESKMRELDDAVKQQYAGNWENFGRDYTSRLLGGDPGSDWRTPLLDASGWGNAEAVEKLYRDTANKFVDEAQRTGQPMPTEEQIKSAVTASGPIDWRSTLTPEEQASAADRYIAREKLAENFDAAFKHSGPTMEPGKQLPERAARAIGQVMQLFGANPINARSEALGVPLSAGIVSRVSEAARGALPEISAAIATPRGERLPPMVAPAGGAAPTPIADNARKLAANQPDVTLPGQNQSQREIAGAAAEAFANDSGLHLQYSSAPDEPAASLSLGMNRNDRRAMIEAFRQMPESARQLFGKLFFPKKFVQTKASGLQIQGWSPEVFAANAHRWGKFVAENGLGSPYETDANGLTERGWKSLYADLQNYVANQRSGRTGAGAELVVPRRVTEAGYFAPPTTGKPGEVVPQDRADIINMLFGFKLPGAEGKPTRAGGGATRLPQNIAGRLISEATQPGRTSEPVEPRGAFGGSAAERQGVAGEPVTEVNPYRASLEAAAKAAGVSAPSMIESWQNLNLNRIKEAEVAPEQAKFGANPLTLQAGFLPKPTTKFPDREIPFHAWLDPKGNFYKTGFQGHYDWAVKQKTTPEELFKQGWTRVLGYPGKENPAEDTFRGIYADMDKPLTKAQRDALEDLGFARKQAIVKGDDSKILIESTKDFAPEYYGTAHHLPIQMLPRQAVEIEGPDGKKYRATFDGFQDFGAKYGRQPQFTAQEDIPGGPVKGSTTYGISLEQKGYKVPDAKQANATPQEQPKTFVVRHGSTEMNNANPDKDLIRGHIDIPLDAKGRQEAKDTAKQISEQGGVNHIITSDLGRTVETAQEIQNQNPGATIEEDPGLRPWKFGPTIEGKPTSQMLPRIRELTDNPDQRPEGGETFNEFKDRFLDAFHRAQDNNQDQNTAIVTHYRGTKLLDAWRKTGVDNDTIDKAVFEQYDKDKKPGNVDVIDKTGAQFQPTQDFSDIEKKLKYGVDRDEPLTITVPLSKISIGQSQYNRVLQDNLSGRGSRTEGPPMLHYDTHTGKIVVEDGMHRIAELANAGKKEITAQIHSGSSDYTAYEPYAQFSPKSKTKGLQKENDAVFKEGLGNRDSGGFTGYWLNPDGKLIVSRGEHENSARKILGMPRASALEGPSDEGLQALYKKGWQRVVAAPGTPENLFAEGGPLTKIQRSELERLAINRGAILIDNKGNRLYSPPEETQFSPAKRRSKDDYKLPESGAGLFSKAWILPDGKPVQLGDQLHHDWLNDNPAIKKQYGIKGSDEDNRVEALQKGFARVNYEKNTGTLTVEARAKDWPKLQESVKQIVQTNLPRIDNMDVHLLDAKASKAVASDGVKLFTYSPEEKMAQIPFIGNTGGITETSPQSSSMIGGQYLPAAEPRALRSAAVRDPETGQIFEGPFHAAAVANALGLPSYRNATEKTLASFEHGFTTNEGHFLDRDEAHQRAQEMKQLAEGRDVTQSRSFQQKGGIGVEHLSLDALQKMNEAKKAVPTIEFQALPADSAGVTNRKDIADARKQWAEKGTESPYFKRWFGDSKVVDESGQPQVVYHGTTHRFSAFGDKRNNPENSLGAGHYFTTSEDDAQQNYANIAGPDLQNRVEQRADMLESNFGLTRSEAQGRAMRELTGSVERTIPAYIKAENPVILDGEGNTGTRFDYSYDEGTGQETGSAIDLHSSLMRVAAEHGVDGQKIWNDITANGADDLNAYDVWKGIKDSDEAMYGNDPQGRLMGSEIARQVFQDMGFDGIELTHPAEEFRNMGIDPEAKHYVVFKPEQIKGAQNRGTFSQQDPRYQFLPKADPEHFKDESTLPEALHNSRYAILSATREATGPATNPTNTQANDNLEKALIADGYNPHEVAGEYKGVDQGKSFLVPGMTPAEAIKYAKNYQQESVIGPEGLIYQDGTVNPAVPEDTIVGPEAKKQDGWSQLKDGPAFSMGLDFNRREPVQFSPQTDLFGAPVPEEKKAGLSTLEKSKLTKADLAKQYPEVVVPKKRDQAIPSDIVNSPLYKEAGSEKEAVNKFADRLESFAKEYQDRPAFKDGAAWYDHIAPAIKKAFGKTGQVFAELLAATSPGQTPDLNFRDALQAHDRLVAGDYDKKLEKYHQGLEMAEDEKKWRAWLGKHGTDLPANPTPETFLGQWIDFHDLKLTKHNGKLFGHNSVPVLNVAARNWISEAGPKTSNFVKNLLGTGNEATIDLWADRTMRWAGYEGKQARWRILPENKSGVDDKDFYFAQKVFAETAKRLGMRPDQLQGALWFAEKQRWADNGWSPLNLGTYEPEFGKIPETRAKIAQEQQLRELGKQITPLTGQQKELMVEPRKIL